jgi:uncharacterized protein (TIGR02271 family)
MTFRSIKEGKNVRFEDDTYDLRNYEVQSRSSNEKIGRVDDVLIDQNGRARYLSVQLDGEKRHVLMPVGHAESDRNKNTVWVSGMSRSSFKALPDYSGDPRSVDESYEQNIHTGFDSGYTEERYYDRPDYRSSGWGRGSSKAESGRLARVDKIDDVDVAENEPDPRGWKVFGGDGEEIGKVDHLIGDTGAMKVRYLVVTIDKNWFKKDRQILIPVGHVDLDTRDKRVICDSLVRSRVDALPEYTEQELTRDEERRITSAFSTGYTGTQRYRDPRYRDENLWGRSDEQRIQRSEEELKVGTRTRKTGEVGIEKHVETEHVRKPVTTHREEVEIERRPASGQAPAQMKDQEIRVPLTEEEIVVEKRPVVKEEIVVRKRDVSETRYVEDDVRKERVDIDTDRNRR